MNIWNYLKKTDANPDGVFQDPLILGLLKTQARNFSVFVEALKGAKLHTLTRPAPVK